MPQLPLDVWEQVAGHCKAHEWASSAGMACKALKAVRPARLEVSCLKSSCSGGHVRRMCMALQWTAQHWSLAETLKLDLRCGSETLDAKISQEEMTCALAACMPAPPPNKMRAAQLRSRERSDELTDFLRQVSMQRLDGALSSWFGALSSWLGYMHQLRVLCVDYSPAPAALQQLRYLRHLSLVQQLPKQDALEALLAALPGGLQTLQLPSVVPCWVEGGKRPIDLTRFSQLTHVACADACTELRLPYDCRVHTPVDVQRLSVRDNRRPLAQYTSAEAFCTWQKDDRVEDRLPYVLRCMPKLNTLQLLMSCTANDDSIEEAHAQPLTNAVLRLPGSFWRCVPALTSCTVALRPRKNGRLCGSLHLTVPASLQLKELVLHARLLTLEFEDLQHSAASLDMRLIYLERSGVGPSALEEVFTQRGLRLDLCQLNAHSYDLCDDEPVQYTCMYTVGCNGAKPRDVTELPCVCGACYECVLSKYQLE